jgi:LL-diaminopimelate aminotransferase
MHINVPKRLSALPPYLFVEIDRMKKEALARGVDVIDLGVGDPDIPTPPSILEVLHRAADDPANHQYPLGKGRQDFRQAVSRWVKRRFHVEVDADTEVLTLIGTKEGIGHAPLAFIDPGDVVLVPEPGYPVYHSGTMFAGGETVYMPLCSPDFLPHLGAIPADKLQRAKLMFVNYPNNPTAATASRVFFTELVAWAKQHQIIIAHDMAYSEVYYEGEPPASILEIPGASDIAIEFHSFSKTFSMCGWRLGFAIGNAALIQNLARIKGNLDSGTVSAVQVAGAWALDHSEEIVPGLMQVYRRRRDLFVQGLGEAGFNIRPPQATFYVWCPVPKGFSSTEYAAKLLEAGGVVATPGIGFGPSGEGFIRFSLTSDETRLRSAIERLRKLPVRV